VDWKGGGQINFMRDFMKVWMPRWQSLMAQGFDGDLGRYRSLEIDYVVLANPVAGQTPVYRNRRYAVYRVR
jgi:hypothetical protein